MTGILTSLRNLIFSVEFLQDATCVSVYNRRLAGGELTMPRLLKLSVQFDF